MIKICKLTFYQYILSISQIFINLNNISYKITNQKYLKYNIYII